MPGCTLDRKAESTYRTCAENSVIFKPLPNETLPRLLVNGACITNEAKQTMILKGVSIADPEHLDRKDVPGNSLKIFRQAVGFGSSIVRIPIHKGDVPGWGIAEGIPKYLDTYIDPIVVEAKIQGVYLIVDLHLVSDYLEEKSLVAEFWEEASSRYGSIPNVIFEMYNEPIFPDSWSIWKTQIVDPTLEIIRANAPETLVIVGSPHWSGHMADALHNPITLGPVAYTAHIYPEIPKSELAANFEQVLGKLPLIITEWGFNTESVYPLRGDRKTFGDPLVKNLSRHGISWTAWIYDSYWGQSIMNEKWQLQSGDNFMGELVFEQLNTF
jgi:aryl-phospho-beta-D-glucosidase BglC (GH1 family)